MTELLGCLVWLAIDLVSKLWVAALVGELDNLAVRQGAGRLQVARAVLAKLP